MNPLLQYKLEVFILVRCKSLSLLLPGRYQCCHFHREPIICFEALGIVVPFSIYWLCYLSFATIPSLPRLGVVQHNLSVPCRTTPWGIGYFIRFRVVDRSADRKLHFHHYRCCSSLDCQLPKRVLQSQAFRHSKTLVRFAY